VAVSAVGPVFAQILIKVFCDEMGEWEHSTKRVARLGEKCAFQRKKKSGKILRFVKIA
jgi:hypothetical protein